MIPDVSALCLHLTQFEAMPSSLPLPLTLSPSLIRTDSPSAPRPTSSRRGFFLFISELVPESSAEVVSLLITLWLGLARISNTSRALLSDDLDPSQLDTGRAAGSFFTSLVIF